MAKCANCGEINPDNARFCISCGSALGNKEPSPAEIALENAKQEFEKDAQASIDRSKITYVCELCGTINKIDNPRCSRCGKPRPRSEYIAALKGIKNARIEQEEAAPKEVAEQEVAAAVPEPQAPQTPQAPIEDKLELQKEESKQVVYRYEPSAPAPAQAPQVVQPFVIVPYVNTAEKLWQYNPRQMYRYEPYTAAEKLGIEQASANECENKTLDELIALRNKKQNELAKINGELDVVTAPETERLARPKSARKVRSAAFFSLLFSVLFIAALFIAPIFKESKLFEGIEVFKFLFVCIGSIFSIDLGITSTLTYSGWQDILLPVGFWVAAIFALIIAVRSIVRLVKGLAKTKGFVLPLIVLLAIIVAAVGIILTYTTELLEFTTEIHNFGYGLYVALGLSVGLLLTGIFGAKNAKNR